jgi:hypothetical protein
VSSGLLWMWPWTSALYKGRGNLLSERLLAWERGLWSAESVISDCSHTIFRRRYTDRLKGPGSIPGIAKFFSLPQRPDRLWSPPNLISSGYRELFPTVFKRPGREAGHSLPSSAEVKNDGATPPLPHMSSRHNAYLSTETTSFIAL